MNITDFVGKHKLSGVDFGTLDSDGWNKGDDTLCVIFVLDGIKYMAQEDPDDGWRSYCEEIQIVQNEVKNIFEPVDVICRTSNRHGDSVLQVIDMKTNKTVLLVGTDYSEDWYPCCIMSYSPENLCLNN